MQLQSIVFLVLATLTQAAPRPRPPYSARTARLSGRQGATNVTGEVLMCTGFNFTGECLQMTVPLAYSGTCVNLEYPWLYNVSSFTPLKGAVCYLNHAADCADQCRSPSGCSEIVEYPGYGNLSTYGALPWTDNIGSFDCNVDYSST